MTSRLLSGAALAAALMLAPAHAQDAAPAVDTPEPLRSALADAIGGEFQGERVFAVVNIQAPAHRKDVRAPTDRKLLHRLQALCEAFSTDEWSIAPFAVRGTWVVAPLLRDEIVADFRDLSPLDVMGRNTLLERAVQLTPPKKLDALGSGQGIAATDLPPEARDALLRALRPPLKVFTSAPDGGAVTEDRSGTNAPRAVTLDDLRGVRLRARLYSTGITMAEAGKGVSFSRVVHDKDRRFVFDLTAREWRAPESIPATRRVRNTFKPSDLDGKAYTKRLGFHGAFPLPDFLARLSEATGLNLKASRQYDELFVLADSDAITQGEALDGLRLALTAAWRKVGDTYLLTWDRRGLGALDTLLAARTEDLRREARSAEGQARDDALVDLALSLPFADDDPTPWTDAQRRKLFIPVRFRPDNGPIPGLPEPVSITFAEMTAAQQEAARGEEERGLSEETGQPLPRWDATGATLDDTLLMRISVLVPGVGWVDAPMPQRLNAADARRIAWSRKAEEAVDRHTASQSAAPAASVRLSPMEPANRALIVPPLDTGTLAWLLPLMKAKGFSTLFYPAFTGGYATFPTAAFPPLPGLSGHGVLDAAARLARENGVAFAATVESMAWRKPAARSHWTDADPAALGRDILGRTLTEAAAATTDRSGKPVAARGDVARLAPETTRRLEHLLADLARVPGVQGVLFDAWSPETILSAPAPLPRSGFGYALPDRLAVIASDSVDPVDLSVTGVLNPKDGYAYAPYPYSQPRRIPPPRDAATAAYGKLLADLAAGVTKARPAWKTYVTRWETGPFPGAASLADTEKVTMGEGGPAAGGTDDVLVHVLPGDSLAAAERRSGWQGPWLRPHLALYDFRDAPDDIMRALEEAEAVEAQRLKARL